MWLLLLRYFSLILKRFTIRSWTTVSSAWEWWTDILWRKSDAMRVKLRRRKREGDKRRRRTTSSSCQRRHSSTPRLLGETTIEVDFRICLRKYFCNFQSVLIEHTRKQHLAKYDRFFKKFEYGKVLTSIIDVRRFPQLHTQSARQNFPWKFRFCFQLHLNKRNAELTFSVFQELIRRKGLKIAIAGKDEKTLNHLITILQHQIDEIVEFVVDGLALLFLQDEARMHIFLNA